MYICANEHVVSKVYVNWAALPSRFDEAIHTLPSALDLAKPDQWCRYVGLGDPICPHPPVITVDEKVLGKTGASMPVPNEELPKSDTNLWPGLGDGLRQHSWQHCLVTMFLFVNEEFALR